MADPADDDRLLQLDLYLQVVAWSPEATAAAGETLVEVDDDVDADQLEAFLTEVMGPPRDTARTMHDELGPIQMGWFFPASVLTQLKLPDDEGLEALVIPQVRLDGDSFRPLFELLAEQRQA